MVVVELRRDPLSSPRLRFRLGVGCRARFGFRVGVSSAGLHAVHCAVIQGLELGDGRIVERAAAEDV